MSKHSNIMLEFKQLFSCSTTCNLDKIFWHKQSLPCTDFPIKLHVFTMYETVMYNLIELLHINFSLRALHKPCPVHLSKFWS